MLRLAIANPNINYRTFFCGAKIYLNKTDIEYSIDLLAKTMQFLQKEWVENQPTPTFDKESLKNLFLLLTQ